MSDEAHCILSINPGSTSTKIGLFRNEASLCAVAIPHDAGMLSQFKSVWEQLPLRLHTVQVWTQTRVSALSAVVGTGGLLKPLSGGVFRVTETMLNDARANLQGEHASNLGCAMAHEMAQSHACEAFIVDPVSVDEFEPLARYSGHPLIQRKSLSHALSVHSATRRCANDLGLSVQTSSFVIAHLGGGISIAPVRGGRIIDVNDAASNGPFSPERTGGLPLQDFITLCCSSGYAEPEIRKMVMGNGGLVAYLGTNSAEVVESRIHAGDEHARQVYEGMAYQIAKEIGAMSTVLAGNVDAIVLTGGLACSTMIVSWIKDRVGFIAPVVVYPGEDELRALAQAVLRVLRGQEEARDY